MLELYHRHLSNTREIGFASQNTPYIPSPKGRALYGAFSVTRREGFFILNTDSFQQTAQLWQLQ